MTGSAGRVIFSDQLRPPYLSTVCCTAYPQQQGYDSASPFRRSGAMCGIDCIRTRLCICGVWSRAGKYLHQYQRGTCIIAVPASSRCLSCSCIIAVPASTWYLSCSCIIAVPTSWASRVRLSKGPAENLPTADRTGIQCQINPLLVLGHGITQVPDTENGKG